MQLSFLSQRYSPFYLLIINSVTFMEIIVKYANLRLKFNFN